MGQKKMKVGETYPIRLQSQPTATIGNEKDFPYTATGTKSQCVNKYCNIWWKHAKKRGLNC